MIDKSSRYAKVAVSTWVGPDGEEVRLLELRPIEPTPYVFVHTPTGEERLDHVAHRYYRDPTKFWRIADASDVLDPFDLVVPGRPIPVPPTR
jgi:hypothetical protein